MTIATMSWAWKQAIPPLDKLVLVALTDESGDDDGWCWVDVKGVARKVGLSEQAVQDHLSRLVADGLLEMTSRFETDGSRILNVCRLLGPSLVAGA